MGMDQLHLTHSLADAFNALADEVQILADRKTVLEHKLRFAHEQVSFASDCRFLPGLSINSSLISELNGSFTTTTILSYPFGPDTGTTGLTHVVEST